MQRGEDEQTHEKCQAQTHGAEGSHSGTTAWDGGGRRWRCWYHEQNPSLAKMMLQLCLAHWLLSTGIGNNRKNGSLPQHLPSLDMVRDNEA